MADVYQTTGVKFVEPSNAGKLIRIYFTSRQGDVEIHMPTTGLTSFLPILSKAAKVAKLKADQSATLSAYDVGKWLVGTDSMKGVVMAMTDPDDQVEFPFHLTKQQAQGIAKALLKAAEELSD